MTSKEAAVFNRLNNMWFSVVTALMGALILQSFAMTMTPHGQIRNAFALIAVGLVAVTICALVLEGERLLASFIVAAGLIFSWRFSASIPDIQARGLIWVAIIVAVAFLVEIMQPISWVKWAWNHAQNPLHHHP